MHTPVLFTKVSFSKIVLFSMTQKSKLPMLILVPFLYTLPFSSLCTHAAQNDDPPGSAPHCESFDFSPLLEPQMKRVMKNANVICYDGRPTRVFVQVVMALAS